MPKGVPNKEPFCSVVDCNLPFKCRGLCKKHYECLIRAEVKTKLRVLPADFKKCSSCERKSVAKGLCKKHYSSFMYYEDRKDSVKVEKKRKQNREVVNYRNGFTPELVQRMLLEQNNKCAVCTRELTHGIAPSGMRRDHCHTTKRPRGILCHTCNISIGLYEKQQKPFGLTIEPYEIYIRRVI